MITDANGKPVTLPMYRSHKVVRAAQISAIAVDLFLTLAPAGGVPAGTKVTPTNAWWHRNDPEPGGYYVVYEDGYASYSPRAAFEGGYVMTALNEHAADAPATPAQGYAPVDASRVAWPFPSSAQRDA